MYGALVIAVGWLGVMVATPSLAATGVSSGRSLPRVALLRSSKAPPIEEAARVITEGLQRQQPRVEVLSYLLPQRGQEAETFSQIQQTRPDVVLTLGTRATRAVLAHRWDDTPLVYSMVLSPRQAGIEGKNVTGIMLEVAPEEQFKLLRRLVPSARTVGVLYDPEDSGLVVDEARRSAPRFGLRLETETVSSPSESLRAADRLVRRVDVLWAVPDSSVFTPLTTGAIQLEALQRRVPVLGMSASHARTGALAALTLDYADVGRQTLELVRRVIAKGSADAIPVARPRKTEVVVNVRTARRLGLALDPAVTRQAIEVVR